MKPKIWMRQNLRLFTTTTNKKPSTSHFERSCIDFEFWHCTMHPSSLARLGAVQSGDDETWSWEACLQLFTKSFLQASSNLGSMSSLKGGAPAPGPIGNLLQSSTVTIIIAVKTIIDHDVVEIWTWCNNLKRPARSSEPSQSKLTSNAKLERLPLGQRLVAHQPLLLVAVSWGTWLCTALVASGSFAATIKLLIPDTSQQALMFQRPPITIWNHGLVSRICYQSINWKFHLKLSSLCSGNAFQIHFGSSPTHAGARCPRTIWLQKEIAFDRWAARVFSQS